MTDESSPSSSHLSVDMATTDVAHTTGDGNTMTSLSSRGIEFYFHCALVVIGLVGMVANALILYAMVASKQHKKHVLIFNQNALDLFASIFLITSHSVKLCNIYLTGSLGYYLCVLVVSDGLIVCSVNGSIINLALITVGRYLRVVHSVWSKNKERKWMRYVAGAISWIASIIYNLPLVFSTTAVVDGTCYAYAFWKNQVDRVIHSVCDFMIFYAMILLIFIFCYWRILVVIRRQARVMASHNDPGPSTSTAQSHTLSDQQSNVVKTMILVSGFFAISWFPLYVYILVLSLNPNPTLPDSSFYAFSFLAFLYSCANPFIYATKFDPVRKILLDKFSCKKTSGQAAGNAGIELQLT